MQDFFNEEFSQKALKWVQDKKNPLILIFLPATLILISLVSWRGFDTITSQNRLKQLILINDQKTIADQNYASSLQFLEEQLNQLNAQDPSTTTEKNKLEEEIAQSQPKYEQVLKDYEAFFFNYPNTREGRMAGLQAARIYLSDQKYQKAVEIFDSMFKTDSQDLFYDTLVRPVYAGILEQTQQYQQSLNQIDLMIDKLDKTRDFSAISQNKKPQLLYAKARVAAQLGDIKTVRETTDRLVQQYPSSEETRLALAIQILHSSKPTTP